MIHRSSFHSVLSRSHWAHGRSHFRSVSDYTQRLRHLGLRPRFAQMLPMRLCSRFAVVTLPLDTPRPRFRPHKFHIPRFCLSTKAQSFHCSSSPQQGQSPRWGPPILAKCRWAAPSLFLPCGSVHRGLRVYGSRFSMKRHFTSGRILCIIAITDEKRGWVSWRRWWPWPAAWCP